MAFRAVACPKCQSKLKLAKPPSPGKRIRCPKCGSAFTVGTQQPDEDPYVDDDPWADAPPPSTRRSGGRRRKRKSSASLKMPLIILVAAVVLVGVGLGIALVVKNLPGDLADSLDLTDIAGDLGIGGEIDYTYMPPGTSQIGLIRPRTRWNSSVSEELRDPARADQILAEFESRFGLAYTNIESITFFHGSAGSVQVVELVEPVNSEAVTSRIQGGQPASHGDATYHRMAGDQAGDAVYFVSETTILVAPESIVTGVIDGTFTPGDSSAFAWVDGSSDLLDAANQIDRDWLWSQLNNHATFQMFRGGSREFESQHGDSIVAVADGVRLGSSAEYRQTLRFSTEEQAEQAAAWIEEEITQEREHAAGELAEIDSRLASAREAEQQRVERVENGENPFNTNRIERVSDVEETRQQQQGRLAAFEASDVSRSGVSVTLVTRLSAEHLAGEEHMRERIAGEMIVSSVSHALAWSQIQMADLAGGVPGDVSIPAQSPAETSIGNKQRVFEFTYDIQRYARPDVSQMEAEMETALLDLDSYVAESASVDVAEARVSFQVTNEYHNQPAVQRLRRIGLMLDEFSAQERELMREVPERLMAADTTRLEFEILNIRPGSADRAALADQTLQTARGYVAGSVVIDEEANRVTAEFTGRPNTAQIVSMLRGAGVFVQPANSGMARGRSVTVTVSVYYETFSGEGPVGEAVLKMVEDLPGYVADSLQHDEAAHYVTFEYASRRPPSLTLRQTLHKSGFRSHAMMTGSEPTPVEELQEILRRGRERE